MEVTPVVGVHVGPGLVGTAIQPVPGLGCADMASHLLWLAGAYLAGTLPSTLIAARMRGGAGGAGTCWRRPAASRARPTRTS